MNIKNKKERVEGRLDKNRSGFAFLVRNDGLKPDIYIRKDKQAAAMDNDLVEAEIISGGRGGRPEGRVVKIIKRASNEIVGTLRKIRGSERFEPLGSSERINILKNGLSDEASDGDRVIVRLERMPSAGRPAAGKVIRVMGPAGIYGTEVEVTLRHCGIREKFNEEVISDAGRAAARMKAGAEDEREDLRRLECFTVDPETAMDFDDAVSLSLEKEGYLLGVHIADVSHFVREGGPLDREAYERGCSVYLPGRVIPMLPEELSNDICSLKPGRDRYALSVMINLDREGRPVKTKFAKSIIRSRRRLSYDEAEALLEGKGPAEKSIRDSLVNMSVLAGKLSARRQKRGAIDFEFPELKVLLDSEGKVSEIKRAERKTSSRIIEEFMILANEAAAALAAEKNIPCIYRVHEKPEAEKLEVFREFLSIFGIKLPGRGNLAPGHLQDILSSIKGGPKEALISRMMLRSLQQAVYSPVNRGHFALASEAYTHFTSPIRRYPDLIVHRVISGIASKSKFDPERKQLYKDKLAERARELSEKERRAEEAERETVNLKIMEFMGEKLGEVFKGVVSGVTSFGIFVETESGLEGLVSVKNLKGDYYRYIEKEMLLRGKRSKKEFRIGDEIKVRLVRIDMERRETDFIPV